MIYGSWDYAKQNELIDMGDVAGVRKRPQENSERSERTERRKLAGRQRPTWVLAKRSKNSSGTLSVVIERIFHERINKLRTFI